jgi:hypothetical protein
VTGNFYATAILFAVSLFAAGVLMLTVVVRDVIPAMRMPLGRPAE